MNLTVAFPIPRRRHPLAETPRRQYRQRLERQLDAGTALAPTPEIAPGNNSSERELRPTATDPKVTGGFRVEPIRACGSRAVLIR